MSLYVSLSIGGDHCAFLAKKSTDTDTCVKKAGSSFYNFPLHNPGSDDFLSVLFLIV